MSHDIITLKGGRQYATWPFTLNAAHERGLKRLEVEVLQFPSPDNGHHAVVRATAEFEDGRIFTDIGDAVPLPNSPQVRPLALASTRAQGRVLRSACNIGEAIAEEMGESAADGGSPRAEAGADQFCAWEGCGVQITAGQMAVSQRAFGRSLCPAHQARAREA